MTNLVKNLNKMDVIIPELNSLLDGIMADQFPLGDLLFELQNVCLANGGFANLAAKTGLGRESLYKILSHNGNPHLSTILDIIHALGLKLTFEKNNAPIFKSLKNTLNFTHPELSKQWNHESNTISPSDISAGSHVKVWWICPKGKDHIWLSSVIKRSKGAGCPMCLGQKVVYSNSLFNTHSNLAKEWNEEKNFPLSSETVIAGSNKKVWWICEKGHEWADLIRNRVIGKGCPFCIGICDKIPIK